MSSKITFNENKLSATILREHLNVFVIKVTEM